MSAIAPTGRKDVTYWLRVHCEQEPLSASRITLSPERDAMGMFRSRIDWQVSPLEWKTIQRFTQMAKQALEKAGLAKLEPQPELALEDGYRHVTFDDSYHWMGGTRMSGIRCRWCGRYRFEIPWRAQCVCVQRVGLSGLWICEPGAYPAGAGDSAGRSFGGSRRQRIRTVAIATSQVRADA